MTGALELVDGWPSGQAGAGLVGPGGRILATHGDTPARRRWASVTKLLTAYATLIAVEEGTVKLDDAAGPPGSTVRHLLSHTSGLAFNSDKVMAAPGRRRIYSSAAFEVVAAHVSAAAGIPFGRYLREGVLEPLGMTATRVDGTADAAAGATGPLDDLLRLAAEFLQPTLISDETMALAALTVAFPGLGGRMPGFGRQDPLDWGLGFEIRDRKSPHWTGGQNSPRTFGHFGSSGTFLWVDPDARLALAAVAGSEFAPWCRDAWPALSDAVLAEFAAATAAGP